MWQEAADAIRRGDVDGLARVLDAEPALIHAYGDGERTLLHVAADWPGHGPRVREVIELLAASGAAMSAAFAGPRHAETPLHWAASSDDVVALDALLDCGADIEAPGSIIDGGSALADAVAFRQWKAARRLVERGARTALWQAAALGLMDRLEAHWAAGASKQEITNAFWNACHGGQRAAAEILLARGADLHWVGHGGQRPLDTAAAGGFVEVAAWLIGLGARHAR